MIKRIALIISIALLTLYLILLIPSTSPSVPQGSDKPAFAWKQDKRWQEIERRFVEAKKQGCANLTSQIVLGFGYGNSLLDSLSATPLNPDAPIFGRLENKTFELAISIAACPQFLSRFQAYTTKLRNAVKDQSIHWDMNSETAQETIYRLLYGARSALEEVMLAAPSDTLPALQMENDEPSATPFTRIFGVTIHSGDILISRGGVPTSALIARGNNFQGNFSHAALVYVDPKTNLASIIQSLIEEGVTVSSLENYLHDKKFRVMVLRPRHDLPMIVNAPILPHKVAEEALNDALRHHIPYDFAMDSQNNSEMFCSEVVSYYYLRSGIKLWTKTSHISSPGVASWLADFGVTHFDTQIPSDLEYDPQVQVVAEWRNIETLYKDHIDNAVIDAMLEGAESGERLSYNIFLLPIARAAKLYNWILNQFGGIGPIPEGMSAESALRNTYLTSKHSMIVARTLKLAQIFQDTTGYRPPYWELLNLARQAKAEIDRH